jgi:hypothetical protein
MGNDLCQDGLCLITKCIVRSVVSMRGEFEGFCELPFKVDSQADRYLIASETITKLIK